MITNDETPRQKTYFSLYVKFAKMSQKETDKTRKQSLVNIANNYYLEYKRIGGWR